MHLNNYFAPIQRDFQEITHKKDYESVDDIIKDIYTFINKYVIFINVRKDAFDIIEDNSNINVECTKVYSEYHFEDFSTQKTKKYVCDFMITYKDIKLIGLKRFIKGKAQRINRSKFFYFNPYNSIVLIDKSAVSTILTDILKDRDRITQEYLKNYKNSIEISNKLKESFKKVVDAIPEDLL